MGSAWQYWLPRPAHLARGGDVLDELTPIAAMDLNAALARGTDERDRETRVIRHRKGYGFSITGMALDADVFGINGFVALEIIERAACAPGPRTQCAPILHPARLPLPGLVGRRTTPRTPSHYDSVMAQRPW